MKIPYKSRPFILLTLLLALSIGLSPIHGYSASLAEAIEYRGGNGMHSPNGKWYAEVLDGHFDEKEKMYFRFKLYHGDFGGKTISEDVIPDVDLIVPCKGINVRSMDLHWSSNGDVFFAKYVSVVDVLSFSYDLSDNTFKLNRSKRPRQGDADL